MHLNDQKMHYPTGKLQLKQETELAQSTQASRFTETTLQTIKSE